MSRPKELRRNCRSNESSEVGWRGGGRKGKDGNVLLSGVDGRANRKRCSGEDGRKKKKLGMDPSVGGSCSGALRFQRGWRRGQVAFTSCTYSGMSERL